MPALPFTPNLDAPDSRGWGGHLRRHLTSDIAACLLIWFAGVFVNGRYSSGIWILWTPLWVTGSAISLYLGHRPRLPLVVCDKQGLTLCHNKQQWRWQALADVSVLSSGLQLAICPRHGVKQLFSHPRLNAADYADIARVAQNFLHHRVAASPATIRGQRLWFRTRATIRKANFTLLKLLIFTWLVLFFFIGDWLHNMTISPHPLLIAINLGGIAILIYLLRRLYYHHRYYNTPSPRLMARLDADGFSLYPPDGGIHAMTWRDMRSIRAVLRLGKHDPFTHFDITDRYGDRHRLAAGFLGEHSLVLEIAANVDAIIHGRTPPPQTTGLAPEYSRSGYWLYWPGIVLPSSILVIQLLMRHS